MIPAIFAQVNPQIYSAPFEAYRPFAADVSSGNLLWPMFIVILGVILGTFITHLGHPEDRKFLSRLFICGFLMRVILAIFLYLFSFVIRGDHPGFFIGDGFAYYLNGKDILRIWNIGGKIESLAEFAVTQSASGAIANFDFWNAIIYSFTDVSPLNMFFINCFFGALTGILIFHIAKFVFKREVACVAAVLTTFWPSIMLWSTQNLKDPIVNFSVCLILLVFLNVRYKFKIAYLGLAVVPIYFLKELQKYLLIVFVLVLPASIFFSSNLWLKNRKRLIPIFVIFGIVFGLPILHMIKSFVIAKGYFFLDPENVLAMVASQREGMASGRLAFLAEADISTIPKAIVFLPLGLLCTWFGPFPWQIGSFKQIIAIPEILVFYFLFPRTINGFRCAIRNNWRESSPIIIFIVIMSIVLALVEGNLGTLFRHRAVIMYFILIFTSLGIVERRKSKSSDAK